MIFPRKPIMYGVLLGGCTLGPPPDSASPSLYAATSREPSCFLYRRRFPPKRRLLAVEECNEPGARETINALDELREFCSSPNCKLVHCSDAQAERSQQQQLVVQRALRRRRDRRLAAEAVAAEVDNRCELTKSVSFLKAARRWNPGCCAAAPADVLTDISSTGYVGDVQGLEPEAPRWFTCRGVDKNHQLQLLDFRHVEQ
ncbi:conserved hypothetical protein [Culex quinquefasciatus]|uniref:Uncharacterized protein n=1 Tax=Culex quinquefasciatus TaxID=7176 RepID=B0WGA3_CULQU|nr:conserved hypothetical protein [Culex quinquefasciatus]|eukprot:XP_001847737.1 conserved hypothetical protein [Culex quinquefasciatus]